MVETAHADGEGDIFLWCTALPGFGLRVYPSGRKVYVCQVRVGRRQRRLKIGLAETLTLDQARERAKLAIDAASEGRDPQLERQERRAALTVAELCTVYMETAEAGQVRTRFGRPKAASTLAIDRGRIDRHLVPLIGNVPAHALTRAAVQRLADDIASGKTAGRVKTKSRGVAHVTGGAGTAARVIDLLGGIYSWAAKRDLVPTVNPAHGVDTAKAGTKDRVLTVDEMQALGKAIEAAQEKQPMAAGALRLIALTGLRREEACGLRWAEVDLDAASLRLSSTKTGRSLRPLGSPAVDLLRHLPQLDAAFVFPSSRSRDPRTGQSARAADLKKQLAAIFDAAGLADARSHDCRRTFASVAADEGFGDGTIGELLGHARRGVTAVHYVRRLDSALIAAADRVSRRIDATMRGG
ncbi:phage integrase [alpha proteobacterium BAL199]|nr:phage integrase [alpha proteobacterium BAL199]